MEEDNPWSKAQTIDPEVRAYVYSLVNALGGSSADDDGKYILGDDALACLRDLKRWLKLYDEKTNRLDVARCLAEAKLVTGDLLPILASWTQERKEDKLKARVALACLEILVPLTWPLENTGEMTVNHHRHTPYLQQAQVLYKAGVLSWDTCSVLRRIIRIGLPSIALAREDRTARDEGIIKLMLYFLRNVTVIRQVPNLPSQGLDSEVSRSATIEAFREQDVFAVLLTMCSNMGDDFNLHDVILLDILFNLIRGVAVEKLWMTQAQRKGQEMSDLKTFLSKEDHMERSSKKNEWSRHGRFGTMIWMKGENNKMAAISGQDNLKSDQDALFNMDNSKKWNKPQRKRGDLEHTIHDFDHTVHLTDPAAEKLRNFVEEFLDSGFNPLFSHLRKAIERRAERLLDVNYRQFFYCISWFLQAERIRRDKQKKEEKSAKLTSDFVDDSYALVAAVLNQETFIVLNSYMQESLDNKEWQDVNASMRCFTQILITVQDMASSPLEEDQEIAENIQNRIFYEETTHDRVIKLLQVYTNQGLGYLDACTELAHVFLRMLERYSKENVDLQIRSKRNARRKKREALKKQATADGENEQDDADNDSENEDHLDVAQVTRERKFDFNRFAGKFINQHCVDTFVAFTAFYRDLSSEQLKRAHRFFYRVAFKQDLAVLLYRLDIVALFYKMIKGPDGLDNKTTVYNELSEFSRQLFKKMLKKVDQRPELLVELLFSKINATLYYLEYGREKQTFSSSRTPAELEIKPAPGRDLAEQIGIVVSVLIKDDKAPLVTWIKQTISRAHDERSAWQAEAEARHQAALEAAQAEGSDPATVENIPTTKPSYITVRPTTPDIQLAMFKNAHLKLLMRLIGLEILGGEDTPNAVWIIPSHLPTTQLQLALSAIEQYTLTPWVGDTADDSPENLIRRVKNTGGNNTYFEDDEGGEARRDAFIDDSEGEDQVADEEFLFPDNIRNPSSNKSKDALEELKKKRRKRKCAVEDDGGDGDGRGGSSDDAAAEQRRRAREATALERRRKIKSELYIRDSDDETDEDKDREFFRKEEDVRRRQEERVRLQMALGIAGDTVVEKKRKGEKKSEAKGRGKKRKVDLVDSDEDVPFQMDDVSMPDVEEQISSSQTLIPEEMDDSDAEPDFDEDTPLSSPMSNHSELATGGRKASRTALETLVQPRADTALPWKGRMDVLGAPSEDEIGDADDGITSSAPVARRRAGFIIDSDEED